MRATAIRLLIVAVLLALLAGYLRTPVASVYLLLAAGVIGLLAWAAFLLHMRDRALPHPLLTSWRNGRTR